MGTKYSSQSASNYNSSPPPDDGTQVAANQVTWSGIKTKLGDPVKGYGDSINSALVNFTDFSSVTTSTNLTTDGTHHMKTIEITSGSPAISLGDAATMTNNYVVTVTNTGTGTPTITVATAGNTIDGTAGATITLPVGSATTTTSITFKVNNAATGYYSEKVGGSNSIVRYGTWTPSVGGSATYTTQTGTYTKIGRTVFVTAVMIINSIGTGSTSVVSGLPFSTGAANGDVIAVQVGTSAVNIVSAIGITSTNTVQIFSRTAASASDVANAVIGNGTTVRIAGSYNV